MNLNAETAQALIDLAAADLLSNPSRVLGLIVKVIDDLALELVLDLDSVEAVNRLRLIDYKQVLSTDVMAKTSCRTAILAMLSLLPELQSDSNALTNQHDYYRDAYLEAMRVAVLALGWYLQTVGGN